MAIEIYAVVNQRGTVVYIGQARNVAMRIYGSRGHWRRTKQENTPFSNWLKTLKRPPNFRVIAVVEDSEADQIERTAIIAYRKAHPGKLLNVRPEPPVGTPERKFWDQAWSGMAEAMRGNQRGLGNRSGTGKTLSVKTRSRMSDSRMGNQNAKGRSHPATEHQKEVASATHLGKIVSEETRAKQSAAQKRRFAK